MYFTLYFAYILLWYILENIDKTFQRRFKINSGISQNFLKILNFLPLHRNLDRDGNCTSIDNFLLYLCYKSHFCAFYQMPRTLGNLSMHRKIFTIFFFACAWTGAGRNAPWTPQTASVCQAPGKPSTSFPGERPVECELTDICELFWIKTENSRNSSIFDPFLKICTLL